MNDMNLCNCVYVARPRKSDRQLRLRLGSPEGVPARPATCLVEFVVQLSVVVAGLCVFAIDGQKHVAGRYTALCARRIWS